MRTLIIDDDPEVAEAVALCFEIRWPDCEVVTASSGNRGIGLFEDRGADFVVLDLGLPDMNGLEVCKHLRAESDVPIMLLSGHDGIADVVRGLESGADDYVTKPFDQMELIARARTMLWRGQLGVEDQTRFAEGRLALDFEAREVTVDGGAVRLTPTEYGLLEYLSRNVGKMVTYEELLSRIWGEEYVTATDYLKVHVMRLRKKLGDDASDPWIIRNERGVGYKLVA